MKIEEYYNLKLRRTVPRYLMSLGFAQHVVNISDKSEDPGPNEFKFSFHPEPNYAKMAYNFYIDFPINASDKVDKLVDRQLLKTKVLKSISPYGKSVEIEENLARRPSLYSIRITIKFDLDSWEFINTWRLK